MKTPRAIAYCFCSGHLAFGNILPSGAIPLLTLSADRMEEMREKLTARARIAYDNKTLLVPGVPEAADDDAAYDAMLAWQKWACADLHEPSLLNPGTISGPSYTIPAAG